MLKNSKNLFFSKISKTIKLSKGRGSFITLNRSITHFNIFSTYREILVNHRQVILILWNERKPLQFLNKSSYIKLSFLKSALFSLLLSNPNEPLALTCDSNLKKWDRVNINEGNTCFLSMLYRVFITLVKYRVVIRFVR